ncbi:hypothetical protein [Brevibacillus fulvus]|uniref:Uncharacterized protein n=1 Tax=Brevibacillus fulvus TaxID=1125967 RepID=A0A938XT09_9BACL|nr:hypothetical protein [Brevibacillus fulvus]MBM7589898.1 hypothetical protein [Brevibacillus fulvus]
MQREDALELIQRDLDHDLNMLEQQRLAVLLQREPELQLIYDRLKSVSDQLTQLPPVTPKISIVDAILPKLEAERRQSFGSQAAANEPEVARLAVKQRADRPSKPKKMPVWLAKLGSGVAAACLLIGVVLYGISANQDLRNGSHPGNQPSKVVDAPSQPVEQPQLPEPETKEPTPKETPQTEQSPIKPQTKTAEGEKQSVPAATPKQEVITELPSNGTLPRKEVPETNRRDFPTGSKDNPLATPQRYGNEQQYGTAGVRQKPAGVEKKRSGNGPEQKNENQDQGKEANKATGNKNNLGNNGRHNGKWEDPPGKAIGREKRD